MRVAVIADTHRHLPETVHRLFAGSDLILHAGDIGSPSVYAELELIAPVIAVLGNNDYPFDYPSTPYSRRETLAGVDVFLAHQPLEVERYLRGCTGVDGAPGLPGICIHGHTHQPRNELVFGVLMLNPGAVYRPRGGSEPSVAVMELSDGRLQELRFFRLR
jgi:putative phosphoesterase